MIRRIIHVKGHAIKAAFRPCCAAVSANVAKVQADVIAVWIAVAAADASMIPFPINSAAA